GGIFKSTDGGATWKKLGGGLPGQTGRIGLAISASNPKIVMAVVQSYEGGFGKLDDLRSKSGGVFRSEDGGEKWMRMNAMDPRPGDRNRKFASVCCSERMAVRIKALPAGKIGTI